MISIIVVGYNNGNDLPKCLESIAKSTYKQFRVIFIDNNSSDNSASYIDKYYPETIIIRNSHNYGFAKGNNIGINKAIELKSDYILLLNPDTVIDKDCLKKLIDNCDAQTILQPLILLDIDGKKTDRVNTSGGYLHFLGFSYCSDYKEQKDKIIDKEIPVASGAALFSHSRMFKDVGLFDENFFMYHEDVDLCWRARIKGYNIKLVKDALVWHKYSFSRHKRKMFFAERNRLLFVLKNYSLKLILLTLPLAVINELLVCLFALRDGWMVPKINSYASLIRLMYESYKKRFGVQQSRRVCDKELMKFFQSELSFSEVKIPALLMYNKFVTIVWKQISKLV